MRTRGMTIAAGAAALIAAVALAGCGSAAPVSTATPTSPPPTPVVTPTAVEPTPTPEPSGPPTLIPDGTAEQNKPYWDLKLAEYQATYGLGSTETLRAHLVGSGFDQGRMELTYDFTSIGLAVDSIDSAVRFGDECLIGTVRSDRWSSMIVSVLSTGKCLIGTTVPL